MTKDFVKRTILFLQCTHMIVHLPFSVFTATVWVVTVA